MKVEENVIFPYNYDKEESTEYNAVSKNMPL